MNARTRTSLFGLAVITSSACVGLIGEPGTAPGPGPDPTPRPRERPSCSATQAVPARAPIRRLSPTEYRNTVAALFPGVTLPDLQLAADREVGGFDNSADGQTASALQIEQYRTSAIAIADAALMRTSGWVRCNLTSDANCGRDSARALAARAFRRPLSADETTAIDRLYEADRSETDATTALNSVVRVVLQSPEFLYRPEVGHTDGAPAGLAALSGHEIASRLSYFLWRSMPDEALLTAAQSGALDTSDGIEQQARRMLMDARARATVEDFHRQWFRVDRLLRVQLAPQFYPDFSDTVRRDLHRGTLRFLDEVFWGAGTLSALLTDRMGFVTNATSQYFNVGAPGSTELTRVELDTNRAGILTQPGWLASTSHPTSHAPILRGVFVLDGLLCAPTGAPPPGVNAAIPDMMVGELRTTRQRIEATHGTGSCSSCHSRIDGAGFAFENFDAAGMFRTHENGQAVDSSGRLTQTLDADGPVANATELASRLVQSRQVQECAVTHWYRYALGRLENVGDDCQIRAITDELLRANGNLREMVIALVRSTAFRYRPIDAP